VRIYLVCKDQLIFQPGGMGAGMPVDINHQAVHEAMRLYGVQDRKGCFEKVLRLSSHFIEKRIEEREASK
jgi:hypothetical protein